MKLSTKGRYGLRAFVDIAIYEKDGPVSLSGIADREGISPNYLEQLMAKLKKAKLVESVRGVSGGYKLAKPSGEISVGEVLRALEGDLSPVECAAVTSCESEACDLSDQCVSKIVWKRIHDSINEAVDSILIKDLVTESRKGDEHDLFR